MKNFETQMFLLGESISHSKSPAHWEKTFLDRGLDWTYVLKDISDESCAREFINLKHYKAINVTTPWKRLAFEQADKKSEAAKFARGCNFLINNNGVLAGHNVDGEGCVLDLQSKGIVFDNLCVVVCGTGPTAKSIAYAVTMAGGVVIMLTRDRDKCGILKVSSREIMVLDYREANHEIGYAKLIINATTLGMKEGDPSPIDCDLLNEGHTIFDCVYGHGQTQIIKDGKRAHAKCFDGRGMLDAQALCCEKLLFS